MSIGCTGKFSAIPQLINNAQIEKKKKQKYFSFNMPEINEIMPATAHTLLSSPKPSN
jgi:hypothetical protein